MVVDEVVELVGAEELVDPINEVVDEVVDVIVDVVANGVASVAVGGESVGAVAVADNVVLDGTAGGVSPRSTRRKSAARLAAVAVAPPVSNCDGDSGVTRTGLPESGGAD